MKKYESVLKFEQSSPAVYKTFRDYADHYMSEHGVKGKIYNKEYSLEEKANAVNNAFVEEISKRSGYKLSDFDDSYTRFGNNTTVKEFANSIVGHMIDMVLPETLITSPLNMIADFKFVGFGDSLTFDIKNSKLYNVSKVGRRKKATLSQHLSNASVSMITENHAVTVITNLPAILSGRDSIAEHVMKAAKSIETEIFYEAYDAFAGAMEAGDFPTALKVTNFTEKEALSLAQKVTAWNGGNKAVFIGTAVALKSILPSSNNTRILLQDEYNTTVGHLREFNGYDVIELPQVADYTSDKYDLKLKDNRIYVVSPASAKIVHVGVEGETLSNTESGMDNKNFAQVSTIMKAWGVTVATNSVAGKIEING